MVTKAEIKGAFDTIKRFCKERDALNEEIARLLAILKGVCALIAEKEKEE